MKRNTLAVAITATLSISAFDAVAADPVVNELRLDNHYQTIMENYFKVENARDRLDVAEVRLDNHYTSIIENRLLVNNARDRLDVAEVRIDNHADGIIGNYIRIQNNNTRLDNHYTSIIENRLLVNNARDRLDVAEYRMDIHANEIIGNFIRTENNSARIDGLSDDISYLRDDMYSGMSAVAAMGAIPQAMDGQTSVGVGYGNFAGQDAAAIGISTRRGAHAFNLNGSFTAEQNGVSAGYSFSF